MKKLIITAMLMVFMSQGAFGAEARVEDRVTAYADLNHYMLIGVFTVLSKEDLIHVSIANKANNLAAKEVAVNRQSKIVLDDIIPFARFYEL